MTTETPGSPPPADPTPSAGAQPPSNDKKGIPTWGWVVIGCGAILVVGFLALAALSAFVFKKGAEMAKEATGVESLDELAEAIEADPAKTAAEMMIRLNPELDHVSTDDDAGTITFRNNKTGEEATLNFNDIAEGKFSVTTDEGEFKVDASGAATGEGEGGITFTGPEGETRIGGAASLDDVPDWVPIYPGADEAQGSYTNRAAGQTTGMLSLKTSDSGDEVIAHYKEWLEDNDWEIVSESSSSSGGSSFKSIAGELEGSTLAVTAIEQDGAVQVTINYQGPDAG